MQKNSKTVLYKCVFDTAHEQGGKYGDIKNPLVLYKISARISTVINRFSISSCILVKIEETEEQKQLRLSKIRYLYQHEYRQWFISSNFRERNIINKVKKNGKETEV